VFDRGGRIRQTDRHGSGRMLCIDIDPVDPHLIVSVEFEWFYTM
jgi:hypothetical protein